MSKLKQIIESVLNDVHMESGRQCEHDEIVTELELAVVRAIKNHELDHYFADDN